MPMTVIVTLRQANLCDLQVIHAIRRHAILGIKSEVLAETDRQQWAGSRSQEYFIERVEAGELLIAMIEGTAVAWGSASGEFITGLYVCPSFGLRGVGRSIMSSLEARIRSDGHASARLDSSPNALQFYRGLGYVTVGPAQDDGAIPMKKALKTRLSKRSFGSGSAGAG
jgi:GNAT superfamily N-acetyltransferase